MERMLGGRSIQLARVFGIRIGVDASWFIFLFLVIWLQSEAYKTQFPGHDDRAFILAVAAALLFFLSILLHELGHAVTALRNGVGIVGIDLWMFGGLARMKRDSPTAWLDRKIAAAGPLVTLLIAVVCFAVGTALVGADEFSRAMVFDADAVTPGEVLLADICAINIVLLVFNLLPGLPLDGGRIVRALAWMKTGDRNRATRIMAMTGRGLAWLLGAFGVYAFLMGSAVTGVWSILLAVMIGQAARSAQVQTVVASRIEHLRVADIMDAEPVAIPADTAVARAHDEYFLRYGWDWFPVVDSNGLFIGLVERERLDDAPGEAHVGDVVRAASREDFGVRMDEPLESVLGSEALERIGAIMAVDGEGVLRGVVTIEQVARALQPVARVA
jgi:Zn-dependent protease